jgi:glutaredoxin-related protein
MWTGWPTFPMIFVKGTLIGGYENLKALKDSGELAAAVRGAPPLIGQP